MIVFCASCGSSSEIGGTMVVGCSCLNPQIRKILKGYKFSQLENFHYLIRIILLRTINHSDELIKQKEMLYGTELGKKIYSRPPA